jgi:lipopolysaccharide transport system permease protein
VVRGAAERTIIIEPRRRLFDLALSAVWEYRELLYYFVWRDVKLRYKQTAIGAAWAVLQPLTAMLVFTIVFGHLTRVPSEGLPYSIFAYVALLPWNYFASATQRSATSLIHERELITKVYFPRLLVPFSAMGAALLDFGVAFLILLPLMAWHGIAPSWRVLCLPLFLLTTLLIALAIGLFLSALNVRYRDIGVAIPFMLQIWMFASPVVYPVSVVPERWRTLYSLNPMAGVIEGFRWALLGTPSPDFRVMAISVAVVVVVLLSGIVTFRHLERTFADVI